MDVPEAEVDAASTISDITDRHPSPIISSNSHINSGFLLEEYKFDDTPLFCEQNPTFPTTRPRQFTFREIEEEIKQNYSDERTNHSNALDIISTYLRGQKLIYMEAKEFHECQLYSLMLPAIFLSTSSIFLTSFIDNKQWGRYLVAGINSIVSFLLAIINYTKLDARAEAHSITAHQYERLQSKIEFLSGKVLLFTMDNETIEQEMEEIRKKIGEIKETNKFSVPAEIHSMYPIMFHTNVFSVIKKIDGIIKKKINAIKNLKNKINYLISVLNAKQRANKTAYILKQIENEIMFCHTEKNRCENSIVMLKTSFSVIDDLFMQEIESGKRYKRMWIFRMFGFYDYAWGAREDLRKTNEFIRSIMNPYDDEDHPPATNNKKQITNKKVNLSDFSRPVRKPAWCAYDKAEQGEIHPHRKAGKYEDGDRSHSDSDGSNPYIDINVCKAAYEP